MSINLDLLKKYIKLKIAGVSSRDTLRRLKDTSDIRNRAILIGTPVHNNLGDHMIAKQCLELIGTMQFNQIIEVPEFLYEIYKDKIFFNDNDAIFICGGGWMGDLYEDELVIENILNQFENNLIIILPQTIFFDDINNSVKLTDLMKNNKKLLISVRDRLSYEMLITKLGVPVERCLLLPDIALTYDKVLRQSSKNGVALIFRNDREKVTDNIILKIKNLLNQVNVSFTETNTVVKEKVVPISSRNTRLEKKIAEFSKYQVIITDRLHAMIFAYIAGTKCIAFDNRTHKVKGVYNDWLQGNPNIVVLNNKEELFKDNFLLNFIEKDYVHYSLIYTNEFKQLIDRIKEYYE